ncbi:MAG: peroxidase [Planctomycetota bacterium]|nr:MAG: peroxidase [Planctomycetota bacterium]
MASQGSDAAPDERLRALLRYAERLALSPGDVSADHVQQLREVGYDDRAIHDAAQTVAYFSYINRVADGLGVDPEPGA